MGLALIFPGQGSQFVGMGKDLYGSFKSAEALFDKANDILGRDIKEACFQGPAEKLKDTFCQQVAVFLVSAASLVVLKEKRRFDPRFCAGLSLGEYTCLYACGVLSFEDTLRLVAKRAELMAKAAGNNPSCMLAVLGIDKKDIEEYDQDLFYIANLNCPKQVVISLKKDMLDKVKESLSAKGITKMVELEVSGGFHSPFMKEAEGELEKAIYSLDFKDAQIPLVSNVNSAVCCDREQIKRNLLAQLTSPVLWWKSIEAIKQSGVDSFYEVGPSRVLKGILRRIDPALNVENFGSVNDFAN